MLLRNALFVTILSVLAGCVTPANASAELLESMNNSYLEGTGWVRFLPAAVQWNHNRFSRD